jgi:hypothetical protein
MIKTIKRNPHLFLLLMVVISGPVLLGGCKKNNVTINNKTTAGDTTQYKIGFNLSKQVVQTSISKDTLTLNYIENAKILVLPANYNNSWSIFLIEDFSKSQLTNFNYYTWVNGVATYDWSDSNLNDVTYKVVTDTIINKENFVQIQVFREFISVNVYPTAQEAVNEQNKLLNTTTDLMGFSAYFDYEKIYPSSYATTPLVYVNVTGQKSTN